MDEYRFLVDEDLSPKVADALRGHGFDATSVQEAIGKGANDRTVCRFTEREGFVLLTNDDDFLQKPLL